jgi:hypothetical protein
MIDKINIYFWNYLYYEHLLIFFIYWYITSDQSARLLTINLLKNINNRNYLKVFAYRTYSSTFFERKKLINVFFYSLFIDNFSIPYHYQIFDNNESFKFMEQNFNIFYESLLIKIFYYILGEHLNISSGGFESLNITRPAYLNKYPSDGYYFYELVFIRNYYLEHRDIFKIKEDTVFNLCLDELFIFWSRVMNVMDIAFIEIDFDIRYKYKWALPSSLNSIKLKNLIKYTRVIAKGRWYKKWIYKIYRKLALVKLNWGLFILEYDYDRLEYKFFIKKIYHILFKKKGSYMRGFHKKADNIPIGSKNL